MVMQDYLKNKNILSMLWVTSSHYIVKKSQKIGCLHDMDKIKTWFTLFTFYELSISRNSNRFGVYGELELRKSAASSCGLFSKSGS